MNARQAIFLLIAAIVAIAIALLVRAALVGSSSKPTPAVAHAAALGVLVASRDIAPGEPISPDMVTWQVWPQGSIDPSFITGDSSSSAAGVIAGAVARAPLTRGEPLTLTKVVKSGASGFMAATLQPGMRAVAISVSVTTLAGGFVQPNDRVDVMLTQNSTGPGGRPRADLLMADIRVLAVDQATGGVGQGLKAAPDARTVTLELSPEQVKMIAQAQAVGSLSLALRPLINRQGGTIAIVRGDLGPGAAGGN